MWWLHLIIEVLLSVACCTGIVALVCDWLRVWERPVGAVVSWGRDEVLCAVFFIVCGGAFGFAKMFAAMSSAIGFGLLIFVAMIPFKCLNPKNGVKAESDHEEV